MLAPGLIELWQTSWFAKNISCQSALFQLEFLACDVSHLRSPSSLQGPRAFISVIIVIMSPTSLLFNFVRPC